MKKFLAILLLIGMMGCVTNPTCPNKAGTLLMLGAVTVNATYFETTIPATDPRFAIVAAIITEAGVEMAMSCPRIEVATDLQNRLVDVEKQALAMMKYQGIKVTK